jgi:hypothetical protein
VNKPALLLIFILLISVSGCIPVTVGTPSPEVITPTPEPVPETTVLSVPAGEVSPSAARITRRYDWEYGGRNWSVELTVAESLYSYYKEIPRPPTTNYSVYVTHPQDDLEMGTLADEFRDAAGRYGLTEAEQVELVASFVQSLPYTEDTISTAWDEYPRYPIETLVDNGGDCEDTSILLASILYGLGYDVVLLIFPDEHAAVGVAIASGSGTCYHHDGTEYFYIETTATGWGIGDIPEEFFDSSALVYEMQPVPILTHEWEGSGAGNTVDLTITVTNLGSGPAEGIYVLAGFDAGDDRLWNAVESQPFDLGIDRSATVTVTMNAPPGEHTRILVQIIYEGSAVDESYSEWLDIPGY